MTRQSTLRWSIAAFTAAVTAACAAPEETLLPNDLGTERAAIQAGTRTVADPAVVALVSGGGVSCSGTLIHPRVVLTAAHCLRPDLEVFFGVSFLEVGEKVSVIDSRRHPGFDPATLANDVALLLISRPAAAGIRPVALYDRAFDESLIGQPVRIVGFGRNDGALEPYAVKNTGQAAVGAYSDRTFDLLPDPSITCGGDSGGPAFLNVGGEDLLAGITSAGDKACETKGRQTRVDAFRTEFILPYLAKIRDGSASAGERCLYDEQCKGGLCFAPPDAADFKYCADPCDGEGTACPAPLSCRIDPQRERSVCQHPVPSPGALSAPCASPDDCSSKICVRAGADAPLQCRARCVADLIPCGPDFRCVDGGGGRSACLPVEEPQVGSGGGCDLAPASSARLDSLALVVVIVCISRRQRSRRHVTEYAL